MWKSVWMLVQKHLLSTSDSHENQSSSYHHPPPHRDVLPTGCFTPCKLMFSVDLVVLSSALIILESFACICISIYIWRTCWQQWKRKGNPVISVLIMFHGVLFQSSCFIVYLSIHVDTGNSECIIGLFAWDLLWNNSGTVQTGQSSLYCCSYIGDMAAKGLGSRSVSSAWC